jgi:hypothetical protein
VGAGTSNLFRFYATQSVEYVVGIRNDLDNI